MEDVKQADSSSDPKIKLDTTPTQTASIESPTNTEVRAQADEKKDTLEAQNPIYMENGGEHLESGYYFVPDMQDPNFQYMISGRGFRGRGGFYRGRSWKRGSSGRKKRPEDYGRERERERVQPNISDLDSWPSLETAIKAQQEQSEKEKKEKADNPKEKEKEKQESGDEEDTVESTESSQGKKKGVNWVPFKDIGPPPRSSIRRSSKRRNDIPKSSRDRPVSYRREGGRGATPVSPVGAYPPNFVPVFVPLEGEALTEAIQKQIEYYFSTENLCKDIYLRSQMDAEGWIPISIIANFNRVKALTTDIAEIVDVLSTSELVECKDEKLRRKEDWKVWVMPPSAKIPTSPQQEGEEKKEQKETEKPKQDEKSKQEDKKGPVVVTVAWGPEKKVITSDPVPEKKPVAQQQQQQQEKEKHAEKKQSEEKKPSNHSGHNNHIEKKSMNNHRSERRDKGDKERNDKNEKGEEGEWQTATGKRRHNKGGASPKDFPRYDNSNKLSLANV